MGSEEQPARSMASVYWRAAGAPSRPASRRTGTPSVRAVWTHSRAVRVVVLTGEGRGFCSGADLTTQSGPGDIPGTDGMGDLGFKYKYQERIAEAALAIHECDKPVIAAINGAAVGGGLAFALAADLRIASRGAKLGSVFIQTGLSSCDIGVSYFLPRLVPPTKAMELMPKVSWSGVCL